jgi:hypothetical protein
MRAQDPVYQTHIAVSTKDMRPEKKRRRRKKEANEDSSDVKIKRRQACNEAQRSDHHQKTQQGVDTSVQHADAVAKSRADVTVINPRKQLKSESVFPHMSYHEPMLFANGTDPYTIPARVAGFRLSLPWESNCDHKSASERTRRKVTQRKRMSRLIEDLELPQHRPVYGHTFLMDTTGYGDTEQSLTYSLQVFPNAYWLRRVRRFWAHGDATPSRSTLHEDGLRDFPSAGWNYADWPICYPGSEKKPSSTLEIRLLKLQPRCKGEPLSCTMHHATLQDKPVFLALSYAWGDTRLTKTKRIFINGQAFSVMDNLYQALAKLRNQDEVILIWADALCIDQDNIPERNFQVEQMPKIYSAAQKVVVWLGDRTLQSDCAIELIRAAPVDLKGVHREDLIKYLDDLFSRPYWRRVWVVQELAAANRTNRECEIRCGAESVTLKQLQEFIRRVFRLVKLRDFTPILYPRAILSLSTQDPSRTFMKVLFESASLQATHACDRIYGIRGISPKFYRDNIRVDYSKDMTFQSLSMKVITLMIKKERRLDVLCCFNQYQQDQNCPSWLRDFRSRNPGIAPEMYSADGGRKANAEIVNQILRVRGVSLGRIQTNTAWNNRPHVRGAPSELAGIEDIAMASLLHHSPAPIDLWGNNCFAEMISRKNIRNSELGDQYLHQCKKVWNLRRDYEEGVFAWKKDTPIYEPDDDLWQRKHAAKKPNDEPFCSMFARLIGRSVFMTDGFNLGLGPPEIKAGDIVCVLYGCSLPVVLRRDGRFYTFIGPAYVNGGMSGEFVKDVEKPARFWIR